MPKAQIGPVPSTRRLGVVAAWAVMAVNSVAAPMMCGAVRAEEPRPTDKHGFRPLHGDASSHVSFCLVLDKLDTVWGIIWVI